VKTKYGNSEEFKVKVHQGLVPSPLPFVAAMEALIYKARVLYE